MGNQANVAGKACRVHDTLLVGGDARRGIENPHAVWPAHSDACFAAEAGDLGLELGPLTAEFGEPAIVNYGGARTVLHGETELLRNKGIANTEDDDVGWRGEIGKAWIADVVEDRLILRIDRIDLPGEAD